MSGIVVTLAAGVVFARCSSQPAPCTSCVSADGGLALGSPGAADVYVGTTASVALTASGFTGAATVTVTGLPAGVTAAPLTIPAGAPGGTLSLSAAAGAARGSASATITATAGSQTATALMNVSVVGPGSLDSTFGTGGKVTLSFEQQSGDQANGLAIDSNANLVAAGSAVLTGGGAFGLARFTPTGFVDTSFGTGGKTTTPFLTAGTAASIAQAVALQPDGKLVVVGGTTSLDSDGGLLSEFAVARYLPTGVLDTSFGTQGKATFDFGGNANTAYAVAIASDGKILVAGGAFVAASVSMDFAVLRLTTSGALDTTFGVGGMATADFGGQNDQVNAIVIQTDGKIVLGGMAGNTTNDFGLARYTANGALDATFGTGGLVSTDFNSQDDAINALAVTGSGALVAAGTVGVTTTTDFGLARYTTAGVLDATFGKSGKTNTDFASGNDVATSLGVQKDGSIVVAGSTISTAAGTNYSHFALARYSAAGSIDATFGNAGQVTTDFNSRTDAAYAVGIQADGKIVLAGTATPASNAEFGLARYWP